MKVMASNVEVYIIYALKSENVKIISEGKATSHRHRMTPKKTGSVECLTSGQI